MASTADVKLIASGSVLLSQPTWASEKGACSGDDWDCYTVGRNHLIQLMMDAGGKKKREREEGGGGGGESCDYPVVLVGDYHFADFKRIAGGGGTAYGSAYGIADRATEDAIVQVMSSGMSHSTAIPHEECHTYLVDHDGMREEAGTEKCGVVAGPNWGQLDLDWESGRMRLSAMNGDVESETGGGEAKGWIELDLRSGGKCEVVDSFSVNLELGP